MILPSHVWMLQSSDKEQANLYKEFPKLGESSHLNITEALNKMAHLLSVLFYLC